MTSSVRSFTLPRVDALLAAIATTLTACSSADSDEPHPAAQKQSDVQSSWLESAQHGYRIEIPADWEFVEGAGTWTSFDQFVPGSAVPGEDLASSTTGSGWLVANSMLLPNGMSPEEWLAELDELVGSGPSPNCREQRGTDVVAGDQAIVVRHRCDDLTIVGNSLIHANRGYYFTLGFPTGDSATAATLDGIASSLRFIDQ